MTWSYDEELPANKDKVRALIGDTDTNDQQVTDEAIAVWLADQNGNVYLAAALAADSLAAKYSRRSNIRIDSFSVNLSDRAKSYRELAARLRVQAESSPGSIGLPVTPGTSIAAMDAVREDSDRVDSNFEVGMHTNPGNESPEINRESDE